MILTPKWKFECCTAGMFNFLQYAVGIVLLDKSNIA